MNDEDKSSVIKTLSMVMSKLVGGTSKLTGNLTDNDIRQALYGELARRRGVMYGPDVLLAIEDDFFVYRDGERLFREQFIIREDNTVTIPENSQQEEVQQDTRFVPVTTITAASDKSAKTKDTGDKKNVSSDGSTKNKEQGDLFTMEKTELVNGLIAHQGTTWAEKDRAVLDTFNEEQLKGLKLEADTRIASSQDKEAAAADAEKKEQLVASLISNESTKWTDDDKDVLSGLSTEHLQKLQSDAEALTEAAKAKVTKEQPVNLEAITKLFQDGIASLEQRFDEKLTTFGDKERERTERSQLASALIAHGWTTEELGSMNLDALRKLSRTIAPAVFNGMGMPSLASYGEGGDDDGPPDDPKWD